MKKDNIRCNIYITNKVSIYEGRVSNLLEKYIPFNKTYIKKFTNTQTQVENNKVRSTNARHVLKCFFFL